MHGRAEVLPSRNDQTGRTLRRRAGRNGHGALTAALALVLCLPRAVAGQRDSLDLATALELGRARSPALAAAAATVAGSRGRVSMARATAFPELTAQAGYVRYQDPPAVELGALGSAALLDTDTYLAGVRAEQPLYTAGRVSGLRRAAESAARAAEWGRSQADVELTATIARAYYDVLLVQVLERVAEQSEAVLTRALEVARAHYAEGTVARLDVLRAESRLSSAETAVRAARDAVIDARERLAALTGLTPADALPVSGRLTVDTAAAPALDRADLADRLRSTRPDVRALEAQAEAARARATAARAAGLPAVGLFLAGYSVNPEPLGDGTGWGWEVLGGLSVSWPFFDGGRAAGEAAVAEAAAERAGADIDRTVLGATVAARARQREARRALTDVEAGTADVARAARALAIAEERYANGIGIQLDVLEAETELTRVRTERVRAIHGYRSAVVELKRVLGLPADAPLGTEGG